MEHHVEVLMTATYHIGQLKILQEVGSQLHYFVLMGSPEVDIVVQNSTPLVSILKETQHLWPYNRVQCIITSKHYNVVLVYFRIREVQPVFGMVFIKQVLCIVVVVKKRQRQRRLGLRIDIDVRRINMVLF